MLVLVTTNEELRGFHPSVARPGRCVCAIEFVRHSPAEAAAWLAEHGGPAWPTPEIRGPMSLADLYQAVGGAEPERPRTAQRTIGFAPGPRA